MVTSKYAYLWTVVCVLLAASGPPPGVAAQGQSTGGRGRQIADGDLDIVATRLTDSYLGADCQAACNAAATLAGSIKSDGSWADVNYTDKGRTKWGPSAHWTHIATLAEGWACAACPAASKPSLLGAAGAAMGFWNQSGLVCPNWWWNAIGVPMTAAKAAVLLRSGLTAAMLSDADTVLSGADIWPHESGQNRIWTLSIVMNRAVVHANATEAAYTFEQLFAAVAVVPGDGIQVDGSFHQHGALLQSGSYGGAFLFDVAALVALTAGTSFRPAPAEMEAFAKFVLDGEQWMQRTATTAANDGSKSGSSTWWDLSVKSREVTRDPGSLSIDKEAAQLAVQLGNISNADSPRWKEFRTYASRLSGAGASAQLNGARSFWRSDYVAFHRPGFFASVRGFSKRTYNAECVNEEGQLSWHLADGFAALYAAGGEYDGIFAVWDWRALPGTTEWQGTAPAESPCSAVKQMGTSAFVGGVDDGMYAAFAMDWHANNFWASKVAHPTPISARKMVAFFDDMIVYLGANVTASGGSAGSTVATTLNQCNLRGNVTSSLQNSPYATGVHNLTGATWVAHDGFTYVPLPQTDGSPQGTTPVNMQMSNILQNGSWHSINLPTKFEPTSAPVFKLQIVHGLNPSGASYAYAVIPEGARTAASRVHSTGGLVDVVVVSNTGLAQAVLNTGSPSQLQAVFYAAGGVHGGTGWTVSVDTPVIVLIRELQDGSIGFSVSSPSQDAGTVQLTIDRALRSSSGGALNCAPQAAGNTSVVTVQLPSDDAAGSSVVGQCSKAS